MISENDVISQQLLILSANDPRIVSLKYQVGDKFTISKLDDSFRADLHTLFEDKQIIVEIQGYGLSYEDKILYDIRVIEPEGKKYDFHWLLKDSDLETSFYYLGTDYPRFIFIDA